MSPHPKYPGRARTYCTELFEGYPAVSVLVCVDYGFVHDLLELRVLQVVAYHHLQHLEELAVGDVAILVHVVDPESDCGAGHGGRKGGTESGGTGGTISYNATATDHQMLPQLVLATGNV